MTTAVAPEPLLTETEVSRRLNVPIRTLQAWRFQGRGPHFRKIERLVRYEPAEIENYIKNGRTEK